MRRSDLMLFEAILVFAGAKVFPAAAIAAAAMAGLLLPAMPVLQFTYLLFLYVCLVLLWVKARGETWASLGLKAPAWRDLGLGIGVLFAIILYGATLDPLVDRYVNEATGADPNQVTAFFAALQGNLALTLTVIAAQWLFAAFGEEAFYRGYLMSRFAQSLGGDTAAWMAALTGQAVLFGAAHFYQGPAGMVGTAVTGFILGAATLFFGRTLWPAIVAHGLANSLGFAMMYLGAYGR
jgi:hypothetical protein